MLRVYFYLRVLSFRKHGINVIAAYDRYSYRYPRSPKGYFELIRDQSYHYVDFQSNAKGRQIVKDRNSYGFGCIRQPYQHHQPY